MYRLATVLGYNVCTPSPQGLSVAPYYYLKNNLGCYWKTGNYVGYTSSQSMAVKVRIIWNPYLEGVRFENKETGTMLNYSLAWNSTKDDNSINTTFDVTLVDDEEIFIDNGIEYLLDLQAKTAKVLANEYYSGDIIVPSEVLYNNETYKVTSLDDCCFYECEDLKSISLPDGVTSLGDYCFNGCKYLGSVILPDGITSLGNSCFAYCDCLKNIILPHGLTSLPAYCF